MINYKHFEWDENKELANIRKHGIDFEDAKLAFGDPFLLKKYDEIHSIAEDRYKLLGRVGQLLFVAYTEREGRIRIISARPATKKEKELYYGQNNKINTATW